MGSQLARISVVGLGKLGSPMAAVFAHKGHQVIGLDVDPNCVSALANGRAPVSEPGLQALIDQNRERIRATTSYETAVLGSDVTFVIVPTPSGPDHLFSNRCVLKAVTRIGEVLRAKAGYHLVAITSTVTPGSTGGEIKAALESASGKRIGAGLGLCYNPEFIALGSVIEDMFRPDMVLIGESDSRAGEILEDIYRRTTDSDPEFHRMNFVNAELTKISVNTFVTTKISYANMIADMCDLLPGADSDVVNMAVGADSRIGRKYLKGAIGYGGPCFPRDNKAFSALGRRLGARTDLAEATDAINEHQIGRLIGAIEACARPGARVAVLGLSYKPSTSVVEASQGILLAQALSDAGYSVLASDPSGVEGARELLSYAIDLTDDAETAVSATEVIVIMTPWNEYRTLDFSLFGRGGRSRVVIDPWNVVEPRELPPSVFHLRPGVGNWRTQEREVAAAAG